MQQRISVITVCFNNLEEVKTTCQSVDKQTVKPYEHLIVDGSTNNEIEDYLNSHPQPAYRKWKHEPDKGISDAFNKGAKRASGAITHLLNSGDYYYDETVLKRVEEAFEADPELMWVSGRYFQHQMGGWVESGVAFEPGKLYRGMRQVAHPTMFVKKELYDRHGYFDLSVEVAMDYDFMVRIRNEKYRFINYPLTVFTPGGNSDVRYFEGLQDVKESYRKHVGFSLKQEAWILLVKGRTHLMKTPVGKAIFRLRHKTHEIE